MAEPIVALSTPPGISGLAVVRVSGDEIFQIIDLCFEGKVKISEAKSHTIHYGKFHRNGELVDFVTVSVFRKPNSYTGEDVAEITCHGGLFVYETIIEVLCEKGCKLAAPGEFTKRAFLNGKMDLTQVEAVADLIHSTSVVGYQTAVRQLAGGFRKKIEEFKQNLISVAGLLELELDFAEEGYEFIERTKIINELEQVINFCKELTESYRAYEILRAGFYVGISGYPNAGKSTLFNALLERKRAIVSEIPGTTRDYLEEAIYINGIMVKLFDTAGLRETQDAIEVEGIRLVNSLISQSNLVLVINDITLGQANSDKLYEELKLRYPTTKFYLIQNKVDLVRNLPAKREHEIFISAKLSYGLDELKKLIAEELKMNQARITDVLLNQRHYQLLKRASMELERAKEGLLSQAENELIAEDIRRAVTTLGEIIGDTFREDVLNAIFSKFCIGK
ncbi:MAG: tRNA uridine-5-carboxymethylaminomethyl(34) synthesis GTPase MnmE [Ignavibacteria bacterium]|nr:tRNA uridine-5-carboxymethylaminomethyl(34) synthesis GTPase MnmE [Ignavibacteria bacterium]